MNDELIEKIGELSNDPGYQNKSGDDNGMEKFYKQFPIDSLRNLTLEKYCMGRGSQTENFSWWIERGLEHALGRYVPGSARAHLLYKKKDGTYYMPKLLSSLGAESAMDYIAKLHQLIADADTREKALKLDDDEYIYKALEVEKSLGTMGKGRKLRILSTYYPDRFLPIFSSEHVKYFLIKFLGADEKMPAGSIEQSLKLFDVYQNIKDTYNSSITPYGFIQLLYTNEELGLDPRKEGSDLDLDLDLDSVTVSTVETSNDIEKNIILYGPPGTGKTYSTINKSLSIIDPDFLQKHDGKRAEIKRRFDELLDEGRIGFVTFHQSYSYEDFVEGLKATTNKEGQINYEIEDGIFKRICDSAASRITKSSDERVSLDQRRVWKMSLGNTLGDDAYIYDECIENNYVLLGYGGDIDFTGCNNKDSVIEKYIASGRDVKSDDYAVSSVLRFLTIKRGDILVVSDGNHKFRAIGEVVSDYRLLNDGREQYFQCRDVNWLRVYSPSKPKEELFKKSLSQQTLYELKPGTVKRDALEIALQPESSKDYEKNNKPYVLIIDEINRGNISRIFGELITLLEPGKRKDDAEALCSKLPYSKKSFAVPNNLYVIGTMNTADRSLALMDTALRRRFVFQELMPHPELLEDVDVEGIQIGTMLKVMNDRIELLYDREHTIGHSYFMPLMEENHIGILARIFRRQILPLLQEYFFEDWEKIRLVLGDDRKNKSSAFVVKKYSDSDKAKLFGNNSEEFTLKNAYKLNLSAFENLDSYKEIYSAIKVS